VVGRPLKVALTVIGIISLLSIVTTQPEPQWATAPPWFTTGKVRVAPHEWTFLFGPGLATGINTTLLASLIYRSQLVPRTTAVLGLIGGPLVFSSSIAVLLGPYQQTSAAATVPAIRSSPGKRPSPPR
jgi:hypothetical protein